MRRLFFVFTFLFLVTFSTNIFAVGANDKVIIFAAASTTDAINEIITLYKTQNKNVDIKASFTGSGSLARQIEQGAPANIFLSAATEWIKYLDNKKFLIPNTVKQILTSKLVLVGMNKVDNVTLANLADYVIKNKMKIAVGDPKTVPVGAYTTEVFNNLKIGDKLQKNIIYANSVRTALNYVKLGEVEFAFVYLSDTIGVKGDFKLLEVIDNKLHSPIIYEVAMVKDMSTPTAENFYKFLFSKEAKKIFTKYGF